jgi:hypothetical protein
LELPQPPDNPHAQRPFAQHLGDVGAKTTYYFVYLVDLVDSVYLVCLVDLVYMVSKWRGRG